MAFKAFLNSHIVENEAFCIILYPSLFEIIVASAPVPMTKGFQGGTVDSKHAIFTIHGGSQTPLEKINLRPFVTLVTPL